MLHVLDVARTLRRDSEIVASELNKEELYASLKERLLASAAAAGDDVTEAEVDTAIRIYFENLHRYKDPPLSFSTVLAHAYVRRTWIAIGLTFCAVVVGSLWWLVWRDGAPLSSQARQQASAAQAARTVSAAEEHFQRQLTAARSIAEDSAGNAELDRLEKEGAAARSNGDAAALKRVTAQIAFVEARLREEYEVRIVSHPSRRSGVERDYDGRSSGYYLIVEARYGNGEVLPRRITSREDNATREVTSWGEQVPQAVYERIGRDKSSDGAVDEQPFAIKRRGRMEEEVLLPDPTGRPLPRRGRITQWDE
jgi:hypothetical protein